jgi:hypothetical protein
MWVALVVYRSTSVAVVEREQGRDVSRRRDLVRLIKSRSLIRYAFTTDGVDVTYHSVSGGQQEHPYASSSGAACKQPAVSRLRALPPPLPSWDGP